MSRLPNQPIARVERAKIAEYLLCDSHPDGSSKAWFFRRFGFSPERWEELADAFRQHAAMNAVRQAVATPHGMRYTVVGPLETPTGRRPIVATVWIVEPGSAAPRLITAHPAREGGNV